MLRIHTTLSLRPALRIKGMGLTDASLTLTHLRIQWPVKYGRHYDNFVVKLITKIGKKNLKTATTKIEIKLKS